MPETSPPKSAAMRRIPLVIGAVLVGTIIGYVGVTALKRTPGGDVLGIEVTVNVDGDVDFLHDRIGTLGEPAAPHLVAHDFSGLTSQVLAIYIVEFVRNVVPVSAVTQP